MTPFSHIDQPGLSWRTRDTEVTERGLFCLSRELLGTDKKRLLSRINSGVHGESVPPPHTSRDLRPILHENIFLSVLRVSNEPLSSWSEPACAKPLRRRQVGGENCLECRLFPVLGNNM